MNISENIISQLIMVVDVFPKLDELEDVDEISNLRPIVQKLDVNKEGCLVGHFQLGEQDSEFSFDLNKNELSVIS